MKTFDTPGSRHRLWEMLRFKYWAIAAGLPIPHDKISQGLLKFCSKEDQPVVSCVTEIIGQRTGCGEMVPRPFYVITFFPPRVGGIQSTLIYPTAMSVIPYTEASMEAGLGISQGWPRRRSLMKSGRERFKKK